MRLLHRGVTLIELMIVIAVVAILASVAYPSYTEYIVRSNRSAAQSFLYTVANKQEFNMLNARSYFGVAAGTAEQWAVVGLAVPKEVVSHYTVTAVANNAGTPPTYTVTATPIAGGMQATRDAKCGSLTLSQAGTKGISGSGSVGACW